MENDPVCDVCGERKSAHVATERGPFTHPREARGEGHYETVRDGHFEGTFFPGFDDTYVKPTYRFVPTKKEVR